MNIEQHIVTATIAAVKQLYDQDIPENQINLQDTRSEFEGQITIVVFPVDFLKNHLRQRRMN